jgi:plasmid maintenance system antidote protein VapI
LYSQGFGASADVWLRMPVRYDLELAERALGERIEREVKIYPRANAS